MDRSPDYYKEKARKVSGAFYKVICRMFEADKYPEQQYRSCDGLLNLQRKTDKQQFEKACSIAIEYDNCTYGFINNILKNNMVKVIEATNNKSLPAHKNVRGAGSYK